jgi:iron complex outermembrane receptor protein
LSFLDAKASGDLIQLKGGPLAYALGASAWRESLSDQPDALTQQGLVVGSIAQSAVSASRNAKAVFGELNIPVISQVEVQAALRWDSYPNESKTSPKVAVRWQASPGLVFRASYAESYRAPSLKQLYGNAEQGADTIASPDECRAIGQPADCAVPAYFVTGGNNKLKAEKGKTYNLGVVFEVGILSSSVDLWRINKKDNITTPSVLSALQQGLTGRTPNGILQIFTNLQNFAQSQSQGADFDAVLRFPRTAFGHFVLHESATYYDVIRSKSLGSDAEWRYYQGTYATPRVRNVITGTFEAGPWSTTLAHRYVGGFWDTDIGATASAPIPASVRRVGGHEEVDAQIAFTGFKKMRLDFGVKNLLDREPPFSITNASKNAYSQMGFAELYTSRGRFWYGAIKYEFK